MLSETKFDDQIGKNYVYSNFGYFLLGRIIEIITGQTFINYIRETFNVNVTVGASLLEKLHP